MSRKSSASLCTLQCAKNEKITECRIGTYIAGKIIVGPCIVWKVSKKILQNRGFYITASPRIVRYSNSVNSL